MRTFKRRHKRQVTIASKLAAYFAKGDRANADFELDFVSRWASTGIGAEPTRTLYRALSALPEKTSRAIRLAPEFQHFVQRYPGAHFFIADWIKPRKKYDRNRQQLARYGLPPLLTLSDLADWLHVPMLRLAWLAMPQRRGIAPQEALHHYHYLRIPKRNGDFRLLEAPKVELKAIQRRIHDGILVRVPAHRACTGFRAGLSVADNAHPHVGSPYVCKLDLRDFFSSIDLDRVFHHFLSLGFPARVAYLLSCLCTHKTRCALLPTGFFGPDEAYAIQQEERLAIRHLPQGAPTSPVLANAIAFRLDCRLDALADSFSLRYTRYADDLTFSGARASPKLLGKFVQVATRIIKEEGFALNASKTRILGQHRSQTVCGIVTNVRPNISRREVDRIRAALHNGPEGIPSQLPPVQTYQLANVPLAVLSGEALKWVAKAKYVEFINPTKRERLFGKPPASGPLR